MGNRLRKTFSGEVTYYDYNSLNQLETERVLGGGATYYTWTADGEMATKQDAAGWTYYTWDVDESLKMIEAPETTLENRYNSRMQRVWRSEDGDASDLVYDSQKLIAEATGGVLERYYLGEGGGLGSPLLAQFGSEHWLLFDAPGHVTASTGDSGIVEARFLYDAFASCLSGAWPPTSHWLAFGEDAVYTESAVSAWATPEGWSSITPPLWISGPPLAYSSTTARSADASWGCLLYTSPSPRDQA
eukprot:TRINITY_DN13768_c0_g1_i1.p2 TRINITY_DN13768_c0_g1~~TRINITY_DN13768_c0_g1_i1.p2  ORF type:complete len:245 (-),score=-14.29 TRINITY_DN13768_c0_g1_i1:77-811(-)